MRWVASILCVVAAVSMGPRCRLIQLGRAVAERFCANAAAHPLGQVPTTSEGSDGVKGWDCRFDGFVDPSVPTN